MRQQLRSGLVIGGRVRARHQSWTVSGLEHAGAFTAVDLWGAEPHNAGHRRTFISPLDDIEPAPDTERFRKVRPAAALRTLRALIASALPWPAPGVVVGCRLQLLEHQLDACLALRTGRATRVLIADEVGSGKTVQAGILVADLVERCPHARVLIVVPAGLKSQWHDELLTRFGLEAEVVETVEARAIGIDAANPWASVGLRITSLDYVKRADVLGGLEGLWWHLLVVDEAHHAPADSDRGRAVHALARRARQVVLLTATPHDGDQARFEALCRIGAHDTDAPLLLLRRSPRPASSGTRRVHRLCCLPSPDEARTMELLEAYVAALRRAARDGRDGNQPVEMLIAVLHKRAASSPAALAATAWRRRSLLSTDARPRQLHLRFDAPGTHGGLDEEGGAGGDLVLGIEGLRDPRLDRAWLGAIFEAASRAARASGKVGALTRLLRRLRSPVVVFTEYRDTLTWLARALGVPGPVDLLHGLQSPSDRRSTVSRFVAGATRVLLATDAAAEGLNLQASCRAVVLFDLPWTPTRIDQRVGRVDRIGQRHRVHVWMLDDRSVASARVRAHVERRGGHIASALDDIALEPRALVMAHEVSAEARACCAALAEARLGGLVRGTRAGASDADAMAAGRPLAVLRPRTALALGLGHSSVLVLVRATVGSPVAGRMESRIWPVVIDLEAEAGSRATNERQAGIVAAACAEAALRHLGPLGEARSSALRLDLERLVRNQAARSVAVRREVASSLAAHFRQPSLFQPGSPVAACAFPSPADEGSHGEPSVDVVLEAVLVLLGPAWR